MGMSIYVGVVFCKKRDTVENVEKMATSGVTICYSPVEGTLDIASLIAVHG